MVAEHFVYFRRLIFLQVGEIKTDNVGMSNQKQR